MNKLKNNKGMLMLEMLVIVALVATIAISAIPKINNALSNRTSHSIKIIENTDTVVK